MKFIYYKKYCILYSLKRRMYYTVEDGKGFPNKTFRFYYTKQWCKWFYIRIYLGWKVTNTSSKYSRAMTALFFNPFRMVD